MLGSGSNATLGCANIVSAVMAAIEHFLQAGSSGEEVNRPVSRRTRSGTITASSVLAVTPLVAGALLVPFPIVELMGPDEEEVPEDDKQLESLFKQLTATYKANPGFRSAMTARRVETMLPSIADFAAVSSSVEKVYSAKSAREAVTAWLAAMIDKSKLPHQLIQQVGSVPRPKLTIDAIDRRAAQIGTWIVSHVVELFCGLYHVCALESLDRVSHVRNVTYVFACRRLTFWSLFLEPYGSFSFGLYVWVVWQETTICGCWIRSRPVEERERKEDTA
jgi:hypothetical protein